MQPFQNPFLIPLQKSKNYIITELHLSTGLIGSSSKNFSKKFRMTYDAFKKLTEKI